MAVLSPSVPQEVKISSSGRQPRWAAMVARASFRRTPTSPPKECMLDGLPYSSEKYGSMTSRTSGATMVVALLSR